MNDRHFEYRNYFFEIVKKTIQKNPGYSLYSIRKFNGTILFQIHASKTFQFVLGHTKGMTTIKHYVSNSIIPIPCLDQCDIKQYCDLDFDVVIEEKEQLQKLPELISYLSMLQEQTQSFQELAKVLKTFNQINC